jgi:endo-1,3-1,4-beta-glycanase ExoK
MRTTILSSLFLLALLAGAASAQSPTFYDNFNTGNLDTAKWSVPDRSAPPSGSNHTTLVSPANVDLSQGVLCLKLTQVKQAGKIVSVGAQIESKQTFGYGIYSFTMRMSTTSATAAGKGKTATGAVASGFTYVNNSETELDIEFLGNTPDNIWMTNWHNPNPAAQPDRQFRTFDKCAVKGLHAGLHKYLIEWRPDSVIWKIDGKVVATHKGNVPTSPARIIIQHRGTNSDGWGGTATPGLTRYMYVTNVSYTPWGAK